MVLCEEGEASWVLDTRSTDEVDPCSNGFIRLIPHDGVNMCVY